MPENLIYFVETKAEGQRIVLCRWVERFYGGGGKVQVVVDSTQAAQYIDQLLWTFSEASFIPHRIVGPGGRGDPVEPVVITVGEARMEGFDRLVCDGRVQLDFMLLFPVAVHFVVTDEPERKQDSRLIWQKARDLGVRLQHVSLSAGREIPPGP